MSERVTLGEYQAAVAAQRKTKKVTPETALKKTCIAYLELQGWWSRPIMQQGMVPKNCKGLPDRIALKNGRTVYLEFKSPGRKLRPDQELRKAEIEAHGGMWITVYRLEDLYVLGDERQGVLR